MVVRDGIVIWDSEDEVYLDGVGGDISCGKLCEIRSGQVKSCQGIWKTCYVCI